MSAEIGRFPTPESGHESGTGGSDGKGLVEQYAEEKRRIAEFNRHVDAVLNDGANDENINVKQKRQREKCVQAIEKARSDLLAMVEVFPTLRIDMGEIEEVRIGVEQKMLPTDSLFSEGVQSTYHQLGKVSDLLKIWAEKLDRSEAELGRMKTDGGKGKEDGASVEGRAQEFVALYREEIRQLRQRLEISWQR